MHMSRLNILNAQHESIISTGTITRRFSTPVRLFPLNHAALVKPSQRQEPQLEAAPQQMSGKPRVQVRRSSSSYVQSTSIKQVHLPQISSVWPGSLHCKQSKIFQLCISVISRLHNSSSLRSSRRCCWRLWLRLMLHILQARRDSSSSPCSST